MDIKLLKDLTACFGVSGQENEVRNRILSDITPYVQSVLTDGIGNIIAFKKGVRPTQKKVMLCAHMDEVGLIIKKITKDGFLRFGCVGGIDPRVLVAKRVYVGKNKIPGVIGIKAIHLQEKEEREAAPGIDKMYIDIGATTQEEAMAYIRLGDYACFEEEFELFGEGKIRAKGLDDRAGCTVLCELIKKDLPYDTYFAFTVQEEVGLRGAQVAAYQVAPDIALTIETTTAADFPVVEERQQVTQCGGGVVLSVMDRGAIYDAPLVKLAEKMAIENHIPYQMKKSIAGGNDSGVVQRSRDGVKVLALSLPCRYLHSPACVIDKRDYEAMLSLTERILEELGG
jgi:endoglucanase